MKFAVVIKLLISLFLFSCESRQEDKDFKESIERINKIVEDDPRKADLLIDSLNLHIKGKNKENIMLFNLLKIKVEDKNYKELPLDYSFKIDTIISFFKNDTNKLALAESYYYAGRIFKENGDSPKALEFYKKSLNILNDSHNPRLEAIIHSQLSDIYLTQGMINEGLLESKKELKASYQLGDYDYIINTECVIGDFYMSLDSLDKARVNFNHALSLAKKVNNEKIISNVLHHLLSLSIKINDKIASDSLWRIIKNMPVDSTELSSNYTIRSKYLIKNNNWEEAIIYIQEISHKGNIHGRKWANRKLAEFYLLKFRKY